MAANLTLITANLAGQIGIDLNFNSKGSFGDKTVVSMKV